MSINAKIYKSLDANENKAALSGRLSLFAFVKPYLQPTILSSDLCRIYLLQSHHMEIVTEPFYPLSRLISIH